MQEEFKALVHYVCDQCVANAGELTRMRLRRVLWHSDVASFILNKQPLTSEEYIKREFGPYPRHLDEAIEELQSEGKLVVREHFIRYPEPLFISIKDPEPAFDESQLHLVDQIIGWILFDHVPLSAAGLIGVLTKNEAHKEGWNIKRVGETINHQSYFVCERVEMTEDRMEQIRAVQLFRSPLRPRPGA